MERVSWFSEEYLVYNIKRDEHGWVIIATYNYVPNY